MVFQDHQNLFCYIGNSSSGFSFLLLFWDDHHGHNHHKGTITLQESICRGCDSESIMRITTIIMVIFTVWKKDFWTKLSDAKKLSFQRHWKLKEYNQVFIFSSFVQQHFFNLLHRWNCVFWDNHHGHDHHGGTISLVRKMQYRNVLRPSWTSW